MSEEAVKSNMLDLARTGVAQRTLDSMHEHQIALASEPMRDGAVLMIINDATVLRAVQYALSIISEKEEEVEA